MKYCPNCGKLIADSANFCQYCGADVANVLISEEPDDLDTGYRVVVFSRGSCTAKTAREVLADLLGYTLSTAKELLDECPVEVADELSELQALTIAQALAEYGMEVTVVDESDSYIDLSPYATSSLFDAQGVLLANALATLSTLTAANRVHRYRRYRKPSLLSLLFKPNYIMKPPVHQRRTIHRQPAQDRRISIQNQPGKTPRVSPYQTPANNKPKQNNSSMPSATQNKPDHNASMKPGNTQNQNKPASGNSKPAQNNNKPAQNNNKPAQNNNKPASDSNFKPSVNNPAKGVKSSAGKTASEGKPSASRSSHSGTSKKGR